MLICLCALEHEDDKSKFEKLYYKYRQKMFGAAFAVLGSPADAEEAVSEAFLKIANCFNEIMKKELENLEAYFIIVCRNTAIDMYNKNKRQAEADTEAVIEAVEPDFFEGYEYEELYAAIGALPPIYKDVIYLYDLMELSAKAVAESLNIKENAVYQRVRRGRNMIKQYLEEGGHNE